MHADLSRPGALPRDSAPASAPDGVRTALLVSAEPFVLQLLTTQLREAGCFAMPVTCVADGRRVAAQMVPDLIVLDLDGCTAEDLDWACRPEQEPAPKTARTVMLSADTSRHCGADNACCGADLCVTKPFEPRKLIGQLLKLMADSSSTRPASGRASARAQARAPVRRTLKLPSIELDLDQPTVRVLLAGGWEPVDLSWAEHRLLAYLLSDPSLARSRQAMRDAIWPDAAVDLRTVDQNVRRLRRALAPLGARELVKTVPGLGYGLDLKVLGRHQSLPDN